MGSTCKVFKVNPQTHFSNHKKSCHKWQLFILSNNSYYYEFLAISSSMAVVKDLGLSIG